MGHEGGYSHVTGFTHASRQGEGQGDATNAFIPLAFAVGGGLPVRLERGKPGGGQHLLPRAGWRT